MTTPLETPRLPRHLSYSALSSYSECGERYRLSRGYRLDLSTWFATVAGSAIHTITEQWDLIELGLREEPVEEFAVVFDRMLAEERQNDREVKASGRVLRTHGKMGGPNKKDREWWLIEGPLMVERYIQWRQLTQWTIPILPNGEPGIELTVPVEFAGKPQLGYIDRVFITGDLRVAIVDIKGLALDTPLPTPTGWTTMGDVRVGDELLGPDGKPTAVTVKSGIKRIGTYVVTFDDGTSITCDSEHIWWTRLATSRSPVPTARSVQEVIETLRHPGSGQLQHQVPVASPLVLPEAGLNIHPYVLGAWLGDGTSSRGVISKPDVDVFNRIASFGYRYGEDHSSRGTGQRTIYGLTGDLRDLGVLGDKHIPEAYLRASIDQRIHLLQGLMDTDGTWNTARNRAVFTSTDERLARQVCELLLTLGQRPHLSAIQRSGFGKTVTAYDVEFTPMGLAPFALPRKAAKVRSKNTTWAKRRLIVSVEPGPDVETACVGVENDSHVYLAGESMIPTHNTGKEPSGELQLGTYKVAFERYFGLDVDFATFWMGGTGDITGLVDVSRFTEEYLDHTFDMAWKGIEAGVFLPNVTSMCKGCGVREFCRAVGGKRANEIPLQEEFQPYQPRQEPVAEDVTDSTS